MLIDIPQSRTQPGDLDKRRDEANDPQCTDNSLQAGVGDDLMVHHGLEQMDVSIYGQRTEVKDGIEPEECCEHVEKQGGHHPTNHLPSASLLHKH